MRKTAYAKTRSRYADQEAGPERGRGRVFPVASVAKTNEPFVRKFPLDRNKRTPKSKVNKELPQRHLQLPCAGGGGGVHRPCRY